MVRLKPEIARTSPSAETSQNEAPPNWKDVQFSPESVETKLGWPPLTPPPNTTEPSAEQATLFQLVPMLFPGSGVGVLTCQLLPSLVERRIRLSATEFPLWAI